MMPEVFPLADILSVTTGRLLSRDHMDGVYRILNYLTGDNLYTHQLGGAAETCGPALISQSPWLAGLEPAEGLNGLDLDRWLIEQENFHGTTLPITPLPEWQHVDPIAELIDRFGPDRIIQVLVSEDEGSS